MPFRKTPLVTNEVYHVYIRSIAGYKIFNVDTEYQRMVNALYLYSFDQNLFTLNAFLNVHNKRSVLNDNEKYSLNKHVNVIAYCLMPTHLHLVLKQLKDNGITRFMFRTLKSYSKYFNHRHSRKGPLFENRFQNIHVGSDAQLLHLSRYVHLNPTSADLVKKPEDWKYSSYMEYITPRDVSLKICDFSEHVELNKTEYKHFVDDQISYQRELSKIKHLTFE